MKEEIIFFKERLIFFKKNLNSENLQEFKALQEKILNTLDDKDREAFSLLEFYKIQPSTQIKPANPFDLPF